MIIYVLCVLLDLQQRVSKINVNDNLNYNGLARSIVYIIYYNVNEI